MEAVIWANSRAGRDESCDRQKSARCAQALDSENNCACGILPGVQAPLSSRRLSQRQQDFMALLLILLVASAFRLLHLDRFPPGLFGDEAVNGMDALDALAGRPQVFYPANYGREGLHMVLLAPAIRWLGPTALAVRLPSVLAGVATALATYWLGRELFAKTWLRGTMTPLLAALFLSTSYWHIHFSRFGIRGVFTPLLAALAFAAFWRGVNRIADTIDSGHRVSREGRVWGWLLLAGFFTGLGVHFYTASRLIPILIGVFLLVQAVMVWLLRRRTAKGLRSPLQPEPSDPESEDAARKGAVSTHPSLLARAFGPLVGLYVVAALVFAPLGLYFLHTPGSLTQRASAVSLANPEISGGDPLGRLLQAAVANVMQFFWPGAGDMARFYNLPGRPVFDLLTAAFALAGLALCLWALKRGSSPHLFLLLWFPVMLTPTFLAVDRFPTLPRALGVLPGVYFFPALALGELARWATQRPSPNRRASWAVAALIVGLLVWNGARTGRDYFLRWGPAAETFDAYEGDIAAAAGWLADHPGVEVFLSSDIYRHPSFVFLHEKRPLTGIFRYDDPLVHFFDGRGSLPLPPADQDATYLFTHNASPAAALARLPGWPGFASQQDVTGPGGPALTVTTLDAAQDPAAALGFTPAEKTFGLGLHLIGYQWVRTDSSQAMAYLLWEMDAPIAGKTAGFQVQVGLQPTGEGGQITQASGELSYRPSEWRSGSRAISWLELGLPADLPAGLQLAVRVIDQENGVPLPVEGATSDGWMVLPTP